MDLAQWLIKQGMSAPTAGLWATLGVCSVLVLLGVAFVAWREGWRAHRRRPEPPPRGATRISRHPELPVRQPRAPSKPGQPAR
jgi:hypothetical protein